jgi:hypothetical protein
LVTLPGDKCQAIGFGDRQFHGQIKPIWIVLTHTFTTHFRLEYWHAFCFLIGLRLFPMRSLETDSSRNSRAPYNSRWFYLPPAMKYNSRLKESS